MDKWLSRNPFKVEIEGSIPSTVIMLVWWNGIHSRLKICRLLGLRVRLPSLALNKIHLTYKHINDIRLFVQTFYIDLFRFVK